jgi:hypothetical protein
MREFSVYKLHVSMDAFKGDSVSLYNFFKAICLVKNAGAFTYQSSDTGFIIGSATSNIILDVCIDDYEYTNEYFDLMLDNKTISMRYLVEKMVTISLKVVRNRAYCKQVLSAKDPEKELIKLANRFYKTLYISAVDNLHFTKRVRKNAQ